MKNIYAAFVKAQKAFSPALKSSTNPHFKSKYVDLAGCVEAVMDALNANGIALVQQTHESDSGVIVETTFIHESGEMMSAGRLHFPASKHDAQGFMSALTYCRRGSLMAACGIAPEDDDGNAASRKPEPKSIKQGAKDGIGDDLPTEWKDYLKSLAAQVTAYTLAGKADKAKQVIEEAKVQDDLDGDMLIYMDRHLDSKVRTALRKVETVTA
jgi:hypothetical protein